MSFGLCLVGNSIPQNSDPMYAYVVRNHDLLLTTISSPKPESDTDSEPKLSILTHVFIRKQSNIGFQYPLKHKLLGGALLRVYLGEKSC